MNKSTMSDLLQKSAALPNLFRRLADNPIVLKELRGRMRGRRAFIVLTIYILIVSLFIGVMYSMQQTQANNGRWDPLFHQNVGKIIFGSVVGIEFLLIGFIGPALTAGAITTERERQTLDLLCTTLISPYTLVLGKLASACAYLFLLIFTALPVQALAFLIGGVGAEEIFVSSLMLMVNIVFFCALGLLCSSFSKRTLTATVTSYTIILFSLLVFGLILYGLFEMVRTLPYDSPHSLLINIIAWMFCATNSPLTALISEMFLSENHILFYGNAPFGTNIVVFSPWILHVPLVAIFSAIMILVSILFVRNSER